MSDLDSRVAELQSRVLELENIIEGLYATLYSIRVNKRSIQELVEIACIQHFNINRKDFHEKKYTKKGNGLHIPDNEKLLRECQSWFVLIMKNMQHANASSMKENYKFYDRRVSKPHEYAYMSAITGKDKKNRETLMSLCASIRSMAETEGLLSDQFNF